MDGTWRQERKIAAHARTPRIRCDVPAGGEQRRQVRDRPAVRQHPAARLAIESDRVEHPAHDLALDDGAGRPHLVLGHRVVGGAVDQVGERGPGGRSGDLVGHRAGVMKPDRGGEVPREPVGERFRVHPTLTDPTIEFEL